MTPSEQERTERADDPSSTETPSGSTAGSNGRSGADVHIVPDDEPDVFDGYSFKGRESVIVDGEDEFDEDTTPADHGPVDEVVHLGSDVETASDNTTLKIPSRTPHMPPLLHTSCLLLF